MDEAAKRPGRFDRHFFVGPPDLEARTEAFRIKVEKFPHEKINYLSLAEDSELYTFADIELIVSAAIRKARKNNGKITQGLLFEMLMKKPSSLKSSDLEDYYSES